MTPQQQLQLLKGMLPGLTITEPPYLLSYPAGGGAKLRRTLAPSGDYLFDFKKGEVNLPDRTTEKLSGNLGSLKVPAIRSLMVYFAPYSASISFLEEHQPQIFADVASGFHFFNDLSVTQFKLTLPPYLIPDSQHDVQVLASNMSLLPYFAYPGAQPHTSLRGPGLTSTAVSTTYLLTHTIQNRTNAVKVINTDSANDLTVNFQSVEAPTAAPLDNDADWISESGFPTTVLAGTNLIIDLSGVRRFIRLRVVDKVGGAHAKFDWEFSGRA